MLTVPLARRATLAFVLFLGLAGSACAAPPSSRACAFGQPELTPLQPLTVETRQGRFEFDVELADTPEEREIGLMCRTALTPGRGMLFDFEAPRAGVAFWMRNTLIPLDIIFIRPDGRVQSIARNARPLDETRLPAGGTIRGVLELPGGGAAQIGLEPGDRVIHGIFTP